MQIGGSNSSAGSLGTVQSNMVNLGPTLTAGGSTITPNRHIGGTGTGPGNSASGSVGVVQVATSNSAVDSIGVAHGRWVERRRRYAGSWPRLRQSLLEDGRDHLGHGDDDSHAGASVMSRAWRA